MTISIWDKFFERHGRQNYTPTFNAYLEAQIADVKLGLHIRIGAWLLRRAWGNHSDSPIDAEGVPQTQSDCARDLSTPGKKVDRRDVSVVIRDYVKRGYIRREGRGEMVLVDDPAGLCSPYIRQCAPPLPTNGEGEANETSPFLYFTEHIWGAKHPAEFEELQAIERRHKELKTAILSEWKTYRQAENQPAESVSERVRQNGNGLSERGAHSSQEGSDNVSETVRHEPAPSLLTENKKTGKHTPPSPSRAEAQKGTSEPQKPPGEQHTGKPESYWGEFVFATQSAQMELAEGQIPILKRQFNNLSPADQQAAILGIQQRLDIGQYRTDDPHWNPTVKRYLHEKLWTAKLRPGPKTRQDAANEEFNRRMKEELAERQVSPTVEQEPTLEQKIRGLEDYLDVNPDSPSVPRLRRQLAELRGEQANTASRGAGA